MSEKIFRLLLHLYPSHFRDSYGNDALQLFRDRFRDERGPYARLRLSFDLIRDFIVTVPHEYLRPGPVASVGMLQKPSDGAPVLFVLGDAPPSTKSLVLGSIVTILALLVLTLSPARTRNVRYQPNSASNQQSSHSAVVGDDDPSPRQGDTKAPEQTAAFVSIEVRPARSTDPQSSRIRILPNGDLIATSVNVIELISEGYSVPANPSARLSALPSWVYSVRYDIEAKASPTAKRLSPSEMFREVLTDRFHLTMHTENKNLSAYALGVAPGGPKLQQASPSDCVFDTASDGCHTFTIGFGHPLNGRAVDMDDLAHYIANWTDQPVVNRTSLSGVFTISTEGWRPMRLPPPPPNGAGNVDFTHLQTIDTVLGNLGLQLQKTSAQVPVYTVEQIFRP
jgi:uncharacterized protein (TIGR03435 family)